MFVIGVAGQAQMGKDTLADSLKELLNEPRELWVRAAFAANVKKVFCETFDVDMEFVEKWKVIPEIPPGFDMTVRQALQFIGDGFRKIRSTIWLDLAFRDKSKPVIISDVRYVNEFLRVKAEGGMNILVARPEKVNDDPNGSESQIKPYIDFCVNYFSGHGDAKVFDLSEMNWVDLREKYEKGIFLDKIPDDIEKFDVFVLNDASKEDLLAAVKAKVLPMAQEFVFEFPEQDNQKEEAECLISS